MKYLCLVYYDESHLSEYTDEQFHSLVRDSLAYSRELHDSGHGIVASGLKHVEEAVTIRLRNGNPITTDGPFAETKEQLGGFYLIEARDLNEAIRIASKMPPIRLGCIEVRPLREMLADPESGDSYVRD